MLFLFSDDPINIIFDNKNKWFPSEVLQPKHCLGHPEDCVFLV